jgi:hypothetical protein
MREGKETGPQAEVPAVSDSAYMEIGELERRLASRLTNSRIVDSYPTGTDKTCRQATVFCTMMDHLLLLQDRRRRHPTVNSTSREPKKQTEHIPKFSAMN